MTPIINEHADCICVRYKLLAERYSNILFSVAARSILVVGIRAASSEKLIDCMELSTEVDADRTSAAFEGEDLVVTLFKASSQSPNSVAFSAATEEISAKGGIIEGNPVPRHRIAAR